MGDENPISTLGDYSKPSHEGYRNTIKLPEGNNLRDLNAEESWALLEDIALYDNESWNDPRDFAKSIKEIALPQDVPSTSDRHLIELENQVQRLMEAYLALTQPTEVNKITTSCEICSGPHDSYNCMEELNKNPAAPKRAHFVYSIAILSIDSETYEHELGNMVRRGEEIKEQGKELGIEEDEMETDVEVEDVIKEEESEFETDEEVEEIFKDEEEDEDEENFNSFPTMKELSHHE
ncbi:hypothetical protein Tco_0896505 [Tanacetum coccineum]